MHEISSLAIKGSKAREKRFETQGVGFSLRAVWSFLDGGGRNNESDET
jgi:hypothetical protein